MAVHNTDAAACFMRFGIGQLSRGSIEADDVLNTRPWPDQEPMPARRGPHWNGAYFLEHKEWSDDNGERQTPDRAR
jgi:hypothetical protein